jgi:hypothetical protein
MRRVQLVAIGVLLVAGGCSGADTPTLARERPGLRMGYAAEDPGAELQTDTVIAVRPPLIDDANTLVERGTGYVGGGH